MPVGVLCLVVLDEGSLSLFSHRSDLMERRHNLYHVYGLCYNISAGIKFRGLRVVAIYSPRFCSMFGMLTILPSDDVHI